MVIAWALVLIADQFLLVGLHSKNLHRSEASQWIVLTPYD
jgi:hypothetical protein